jgi:hypothetical protein
VGRSRRTTSSYSLNLSPQLIQERSPPNDPPLPQDSFDSNNHFDVNGFFCLPYHAAATSDICAKMVAFYASDQQAAFSLGPCNSAGIGAATFEGPTTNNAPPNSQSTPPGPGSNFSNASWISGQVGVGQLGAVKFRTVLVDGNHRNYYLQGVKNGLATPFNMIAIVHGRNGWGQPLPPIQLALADLSEVQVFGPTGNIEGASTLEPAVLQKFVANDLLSAARDLKLRVEELQEHRPELIKDAPREAGFELAIQSVLTVEEVAAEAASFKFVASAIPVIGAINAAAAFSDVIFEFISRICL